MGFRVRQALVIVAAGTAVLLAQTGSADARVRSHRIGRSAQTVPGAPPSFAAAASRGIEELLGTRDHSAVSWNYGTGLWGGQIPANWWQSALAVMTLIRYAERTGVVNPLYHRVLMRVYSRNIYNPHATPRREFVNRFMDDTGWWGLAWAGAARYELYARGDRRDAARFLAVAEADARYIASVPRLCGGIEWGIGYPPDTIANAEFATLTAQLYSLRNTPGSFYSAGQAAVWLDDARAALSWLEGSGLVNMQTGAVFDGLDRRCHVIGGAMTYTEGEVAEALIQMGAALRDPAYYDQAAAFLRYTISPASELVSNGVLQERCESIFGKCDDLHFRLDLPAYKGLFIDAVSDWSAATGSHAFDGFLQTQARAVVTNAIRGPNNDPARCRTPHTCEFAFHWTAERDPAPLGVTLGGQESGLDALTAVLPSRRRK